MNGLETGVRRGTGRERGEWFELLDAWGAADHRSREIAAWLREEHGLSSWWAQKLMVEYEHDRGVRAPGIRPGGTFSVSASKTVAVPVERLFKRSPTPACASAGYRGW